MSTIADVGFLFSYAWRKGKTLLLIMTAHSVSSAILPLIDIIGVGMVVKALVNNEPSDGVLRLIVLYITINLLVSVISTILAYLMNRESRTISNVMQFDYARDSMNIDYHYVQDGSIAELKQKSMKVNPSISLSYANRFITSIVQFAGIIYIFTVLSPSFTIILTFTCILTICLTFKGRRLEYELRTGRIKNDRHLDYLYKVMTEYRYAKEVRLNRAGNYVTNKYRRLLTDHLVKLKEYHRKLTTPAFAATVITVIQTASMYLYLSYRVFSKQMTIGEYIVMVGATTLFTTLLLGFFDDIAQLGSICNDVAFYKAYSDLIQRRSSIANSNSLHEREIDFSNATIRFNNVSFTYPGTDRTVLNHIDLEFKRGERIGIVGLNGSGKTTLIKLLTRLYDPTEGYITLNGIDIRSLPVKQYTAHIGIVLQDFLLFAYSIKENIVFGANVNGNRLSASLEKSGLMEKVNLLNKRAETIIYRHLDADGIELSGGDGQKLALARALYKDSDILILDEPTSSLDPIAEYELFKRLNYIADDKTVIFISHRLSSTRFCDRILVLENGTITERGSHNELKAGKGIYADLFNTQAQYYSVKEEALK